jgi:hypothetical protein
MPALLPPFADIALTRRCPHSVEPRQEPYIPLVEWLLAPALAEKDLEGGPEPVREGALLLDEGVRHRKPFVGLLGERSEFIPAPVVQAIASSLLPLRGAADPCRCEGP